MRPLPQSGKIIDGEAHCLPTAQRFGSHLGFGDPMTDKPSELGAAWWAKNLDDVDREVARLATICKVRLLDAGVIERVLRNDDSVCGTRNKAAFDKLRNGLLMHYHVRDKTVNAIGEAATAEVIASIVENIRKRLGKQLGGKAPGG
jgi:hypothetical protein